MTQSRNDAIVLMTALGAAVQALESLLPYPVPGVKLGLANVVTVAALARLDFEGAFAVALCRPIVASFLTGSFLSPGFVISFIASSASFLAMAAFSLTGVFSIFGISIAGAAVHNAAQLVAVRLLFVKVPDIMRLLPFLTAAGIFSGVATGYLGARFLFSGKSGNENELPLRAGRAIISGNNGCAPPAILPWRRIALASAVIAAGLVAPSSAWLAAANAVLAATVLPGGGRHIVARYAHFAPFGAVFFALPVVFGGGLSSGTESALRVFFIFQVSAWLFKKHPSASLPKLPGAIFARRPLIYFSRIWETTGNALALACDIKKILLADGAAALRTGPGGILRRAASMLNGELR